MVSYNAVPVGIKEAARLLGVSVSAMEKFQREQKLLPDEVLPSGERLYLPSSLITFQEKYHSQLATIPEAAKAFGVHPRLFETHLRRTLLVERDAMRRKFHVYRADKLIMVARRRKWIAVLAEQVRGSRKTWVVRRAADGKLVTVRGTPLKVEFVEGDPDHLVDQVGQ